MTDVPDDDNLCRLAAERNNSAFATMVSRYERLVSSVASRILRDKARVDDVSQEVFLRLHLQLTSRPSQAIYDLKSWLATVARNVAIDGIKRWDDRIFRGPEEWGPIDVPSKDNHVEQLGDLEITEKVLEEVRHFLTYYGSLGDAVLAFVNDESMSREDAIALYRLEMTPEQFSDRKCQILRELRAQFRECYIDAS